MNTFIRATYKREFFAGLLISIPIIITFLIIGWFFKLVDNLLRRLYVAILNYHLYLGEIALFRKDVFNTDIPIDDGIKSILSGGFATPERISEAH